MARVKCSQCKGTGETDLPVHLEETLQLVRENPGLGARDLGPMAGIAPSAMSNRLAGLEVFGFLLSKMDSKQRLYWIKDGA